MTLFDGEMLLGFLLVPFALAAGILFVMDRRTLRENLSAEQRKALVDSRTGRWLRYYGFFFFIFTLVSIPPVIWFNCSSPCLACCPQVPLASRSMAF